VSCRYEFAAGSPPLAVFHRQTHVGRKSRFPWTVGPQEGLPRTGALSWRLCLDPVLDSPRLWIQSLSRVAIARGTRQWISLFLSILVSFLCVVVLFALRVTSALPEIYGRRIQPVGRESTRATLCSLPAGNRLARGR